MQSVQADKFCPLQFRPDFSSQLYKTQVQVTGKDLSGLLLIKTMPDSSVRVVFSTETGFKFFDFEFSGSSGFKVYYVMKNLDKKVVIQALRNDFELLLMRGLESGADRIIKKDSSFYYGFKKGKKTAYYITDSTCSRLLSSELGSSRKKLVTADIIGRSGKIPDSMFIEHHNFNFTIALKKLER
jgi:hypothetical protein